MKVGAVSLVLLSLALSAGHASAQESTRLSFGLEIGTDPSRLPGCKAAGKDMYSCTTLPKPHPAFESYQVYFVKGIGICTVRAIGEDIVTSRSGGELRSAADKLIEQIGAQYGTSNKMDLISPSSIWDEYGDWTMSILQKDRMYGMIWSEDDGFEAQNGVEAMAVLVEVLSPTKGYVSFTINSTAHSRCKNKTTSDEASVF